MKVWEAVGYKLLNTSAVTNIVGSNVYHGDKPEGKGHPTVNYFMVSHNLLHRGVIESMRFQISCRAATAETAALLAYEVGNVFHNMQEVVNSAFDINQGRLINEALIKEPDTDVYHVPVDIRVNFYASENV